MQSISRTLGVCVFTLAASVFAASNPAGEPAYNPATTVDVDGVITALHDVPAGQPLAGTHVTLKTKAGLVNVYLAPADFLRFFKTSFPVGAEIEVVGSKVKAGDGDEILTRDVAIGQATISLREPDGTPNWKSWGVEVDPSAVRY